MRFDFRSALTRRDLLKTTGVLANAAAVGSVLFGGMLRWQTCHTA